MASRGLVFLRACNSAAYSPPSPEWKDLPPINQRSVYLPEIIRLASIKHQEITAIAPGILSLAI
jgi:hypothetical protein